MIRFREQAALTYPHLLFDEGWLLSSFPALALGCKLLSFVFNPQAPLVQHFESLISEICLHGLCATVTLVACIKAQPASKRHYSYRPPHDSCHTTGKPHPEPAQVLLNLCNSLCDYQAYDAWAARCCSVESFDYISL